MSKPRVNYQIKPIDALNQLSPREKKVLEMRLGVGEYNKQHTLKEIAFEMGWKTIERPRQVESKALRKLRHPSRNCEVTSKKE